MNFSINHVFLRIEGSQADEFLQGQITVDTNKVIEEEFIPSCVCSNKGRVISTFWIKRNERGFEIALLDELRIDFQDHMGKYIPFFDHLENYTQYQYPYTYTVNEQQRDQYGILDICWWLLRQNEDGDNETYKVC